MDLAGYVLRKIAVKQMGEDEYKDEVDKATYLLKGINRNKWLRDEYENFINELKNKIDIRDDKKFTSSCADAVTLLSFGFLFWLMGQNIADTNINNWLHFLSQGVAYSSLIASGYYYVKYYEAKYGVIKHIRDNVAQMDSVKKEYKDAVILNPDICLYDALDEFENDC